MGYPQISYPHGGGTASFLFTRGPQNFHPRWAGRMNDNLSTSGVARERVVQGLDIMIDFEMQHMVADDDMPAWAQLIQFALMGGQFKFYPNSGLSDYYNCLLEDQDWKLTRNAMLKYAAKLSFRVLPDSQAPSGPDVILRRLHGIMT